MWDIHHPDVITGKAIKLILMIIIFYAIFMVPEPIVSVRSSLPNHVFSARYSPTLMCTVEMRSVVNVPLSIYDD